MSKRANRGEMRWFLNLVIPARSVEWPARQFRSFLQDARERGASIVPFHRGFTAVDPDGTTRDCMEWGAPFVP